LKTNKSVL